MKVWVTGAGGFVGARLVARLRALGHEASGADREVDVSDPLAVREALAAAAADAVVHLAGVTFVPHAEADPGVAFRVNTLGTQHVLAGALEAVPRARVLVVSTAAVYGTAPPGAPPFDEASPLRPHDAYGRTKAAADLLAGVAAARGQDVVRARPFNHTGAGRPDHFVESSFARQLAEIEARRREPVLRVGNLDSRRDFLHVADVIDAYAALLDAGVPAGIYNVASGASCTMREVLDRLLARSRAAPRIEVDPARFRPTDASCGTASKLAAATGWSPRRSLDDTLAELLDHWRRQLASGV
jgi:GDP-4-dehydro-6-deoxy-D-mannose reductase